MGSGATAAINDKEYMNILLTGGAGYIGSHTIIELDEAGHSVVGNGGTGSLLCKAAEPSACFTTVAWDNQ